MSVPAESVISMRHESWVLTFPVNPEVIRIDRGRSVNDISIVNFRDIVRLGNPKLTTIEFESLFPLVYDDTYCNYQPLPTPSDVEKVLEAWLQEKPGAPSYLTISGTPLADWFIMTSFWSERRPGEPGDVYFGISFTQYVTTTANVFDVVDVARTPSRPASAAPGILQPGQSAVYTIVRGDSLWLIAKKFYGSGALWTTIYEANKSAIDDRARAARKPTGGSYIFAGTTIVIPAR